MLLLAMTGCGVGGSLKARRIAREGNALYNNSEYRKAVEKYREAIDLDPETPNVYLNLGFALFSLYNPDSKDERDKDVASEAVAAFDHHLKQAPTDEKAKSFRIKTLLRAAARDPALADKAYALFVELLRQKPDDQEARNYLVSLFIDAKRYKQAVEYFEPHLKEKPDDLTTMKILAVIADKSGEIDEAMRWYHRRGEAAKDAATQAPLFYEVATYVWNFLHYQPDKSQSIAGIKWADQGIEAAKTAMSLQKDYAEAMVYANLLYLERSGREPGEQGKYFDQKLAYDLRVEAGKIMAVRTATKTQGKAEGGHATDGQPAPKNGAP